MDRHFVKSLYLVSPVVSQNLYIRTRILPTVTLTRTESRSLSAIARSLPLILSFCVPPSLFFFLRTTTAREWAAGVTTVETGRFLSN